MILLNELSGNIATKKLSLSGSLSTKSVTLTGSLINGGTRSLPAYEGPYVIEPTLGDVIYAFSEGMTLNTKDTRMTSNVVISPIEPTQELNFARVTFNGSTITVS